MSTNSASYAGWEVFTTVFGVGAVLLGALVRYILSQLPSKKFKGLCDIVGETQSLLTDCVEEGLLRETQITTFQQYIDGLRSRTHQVRDVVHAARTWSEDLANWAHGLTSRINRLIKDAQELRYEISTTSSREREARERAAIVEDAITEHQVTIPTEHRVTTSHTWLWRLLQALACRVLPAKRPVPDNTTTSFLHEQGVLSSGHVTGSSRDPSHDSESCSSPPPPCASTDLDVSPPCTTVHPHRAGSLLSETTLTGSSRTSRCSKKMRGGRYSRTRAPAGSGCHARGRDRRSRASATSRADVLLVSSAEISSIDLLDAEDDDWKDVCTWRVQVVY
ncbi:hypothetical protein PYCCODRAFT_1440072 [Trametes coccinea BRFM310]|uniref:Uncharacterized protein n=1 Tax=Trametes coccinea (strain BRFM310) TaxID=1353009 RepID=A0A1Y2IAT8_TRAC3|nr:hypothetical protein PYCCODRAFT_1440072 [Trametes coccinea BRFM310]